MPNYSFKFKIMEEQPVYNELETAENEKPMWKHAVTYGLYFAVAYILISVVVYITGAMNSKPVTWITNIVMIVAIILIQIHYRKTLGGFISYGQSVGIAVLSMLMAAVPIAIYTYALYKFIDPALLDQIKMMTEEQMVNRGMPEEQLDAALAMSSKFQTPGIIAFSQFFNLPLTGVIIGLITSIFIKKQSPDKIFE